MVPRPTLAFVALAAACASTPPSCPPSVEPVSAVALRYYCDYGADASLLAASPSRMIPIDVDPSPTTLACLDAQRRLDAAPGGRGPERDADDALQRACLARRCALWYVADARADRDIIRLVCTRDRLQRIDALVDAARGTPGALTDAFAAEVLQERRAADDCLGERRAGGPER